jgi:hypothetical protein
MPQPEPRAWWSDVQHLRDSIERKREAEARRGLRLDARSAARAVADRAASGPVEGERSVDGGSFHDAQLPDDLDWVTRPQRRFERSARALPAPARRRTVEITGRTVGAPSLPRLVQIDRRRPARRAVERVGPRPDRLALWAVVLGFFLILVAVTSTSHAATRAPGARAVDGHTAHSQVLRAYTTTLRATPPAR